MRYITEDQARKQYDDELDELYPVEIGGMSFCASRVLFELDPTAYWCGMTDWLDASDLTTDLISYVVELLEDGTEEDDGTIIFKCEAEDEDHAKEQAENAYPDCEIVEVSEE